MSFCFLIFNILFPRKKVSREISGKSYHLNAKIRTSQIKKPLPLQKAREEAGNKEVLSTKVTLIKIKQGRIGGYL
jgi:hypothetical protein